MGELDLFGNEIGVPKMPEEYKGKSKRITDYTDTSPREWTEQEVEWCKSLKAKGYSTEEIATSVGRSVVSVSIKFKRMSKQSYNYNTSHAKEKYRANMSFAKEIGASTVCDAYCGGLSIYHYLNVVSNDINVNSIATFHMEALAFMCMVYSYGWTFDLVDLDPFGSAFDCFDLAIKMARKGLCITLGEYGHKRFKRLDYVRNAYGIDSMEAFTLDNMIKVIQRIGAHNKKKLTVWKVADWNTIGRVWFTVEPMEKMAPLRKKDLSGNEV